MSDETTGTLTLLSNERSYTPQFLLPETNYGRKIQGSWGEKCKFAGFEAIMDKLTTRRFPVSTSDNKVLMGASDKILSYKNFQNHF